jgi:hypothetical protein
LLDFSAALADKEIWRRRHSERNRYSREYSLARKETTWDEFDRGLAVQDLLAALSGRERGFCLTELLRQTKPAAASPVSAANVWQPRNRVLKKLGPADSRTIRCEHHVSLSGHGRLRGLLL